MLSGCGHSRPPGTEVVGEVVLNGKPVAAAHVFFTTKSSGKKSDELPATFSATVVDGSFLFDQQDGPPPGEYEVVVKPVEPDAEEAMAELVARKGTLIQQRDDFLAAARRKGPIQVELSADDVNNVVIELSSR
jgi:hypothetical protein